MDTAGIIAIVMLVLVFVTMIVAILKEGVGAAIKLWTVMGALTGVGFGGIVSYYFTNNSNQAEIQTALHQKAAAVSVLKNTVKKATEANEIVLPLAIALRGEEITSPNLPISRNAFLSIPEKDKEVLTDKIERVISNLNEIQKVEEITYQDKKPIEKK